jgi:hypothetical protein
MCFKIVISDLPNKKSGLNGIHPPMPGRIGRYIKARNGSTWTVCLSLRELSYIAHTSGCSRYPGIFVFRSGWCSCSTHSVGLPGILHTMPGRCTLGSPGKHTQRAVESGISRPLLILPLLANCKVVRPPAHSQPLLAAPNSSSEGGFSSAIEANDPDLIDPAASDIKITLRRHHNFFLFPFFPAAPFQF